MSTAASLVGTGITLGIVHVLTGPDHLSALATLSANVIPSKATWFGIRWGVGHSTGLIIVGSILIAISSNMAEEHMQVPEQLTNILESIVGIFMILLGSYGIAKAIRKRHEIVEHDAIEADTLKLSIENPAEASMSLADVGDTAVIPQQQSDDSAKSSTSCATTSRISTGTMALLVGIVHGVAGPGGVLGVIPAVQIRDPWLATLYLGTFCLTSTITMGVFAALYGFMTTKIVAATAWEFRLEVISASLSVVVGILWLVLLALGDLEKIFG